MFEISITTEFSSAHNLRGYKGKCESLHGHNWKVEVKVASSVLDKIGMVMDFKDLRNIVHNVIDKLDHQYLNDIPYFSIAGRSTPDRKKVNPTSENIAKFIFDQISQSLKKKKGIILKSVSVWENDRSMATYSLDK